LEAQQLSTARGDGSNGLDSFIMTVIENRNVHEHQHINGCTSHELLQDISSLASIDVYHDPLMALDANITRGFQKKVP
jgi:hypothetical protein